MKPLILAIVLLLAHGPIRTAAANGPCAVWNDGLPLEEKLQRAQLQNLRDIMWHAKVGLDRRQLAAMGEPELVARMNQLDERTAIDAVTRARAEAYRPELTFGRSPLPVPLAEFPAWYHELRPGERRVWVDREGSVRLVERSADGASRRVSDPFAMFAADAQGNPGFIYFENFGRATQNSVRKAMVGRTHFKTALEFFHQDLPVMTDISKDRAIPLPGQMFSRPGAPENAPAAKLSSQTMWMRDAPARPQPRVAALFEGVKPKAWEISQFMQSSLPVRMSSGEVGFLPIFSNGEGKAYATTKLQIFEGARVADLPKGKSYNFLILPDGSMVFGERTTAAEFGVKHVQLAAGRSVVSAGEIRIDPDGAVHFNIESGSYSKSIAGKIGNDVLLEKTRLAFATQGVRAKPGLEKIAPEPLSAHELRELCLVPLFFKSNAHLCTMTR